MNGSAAAVTTAPWSLFLRRSRIGKIASRTPDRTRSSNLPEKQFRYSVEEQLQLLSPIERTSWCSYHQEERKLRNRLPCPLKFAHRNGAPPICIADGRSYVKAFSDSRKWKGDPHGRRQHETPFRILLWICWKKRSFSPWRPRLNPRSRLISQPALARQLPPRPAVVLTPKRKWPACGCGVPGSAAGPDTGLRPSGELDLRFIGFRWNRFSALSSRFWLSGWWRAAILPQVCSRISTRRRSHG